MLSIISLFAALASPQSYVFQFSTDCGNRTIHGLWPQWGEWCGGSLDEGAIEPLHADLVSVWPSCVGDDNATSFHAHEWLKHGTCSDYGETDYFATAIHLFKVFRSIPGTRVCLARGSLEPFDCGEA